MMTRSLEVAAVALHESPNRPCTDPVAFVVDKAHCSRTIGLDRKVSWQRAAPQGRPRLPCRHWQQCVLILSLRTSQLEAKHLQIANGTREPLLFCRRSGRLGGPMASALCSSLHALVTCPRTQCDTLPNAHLRRFLWTSALLRLVQR